MFKVNKSPMRITYTPRGNYIMFRGAQQELERIKSLKSANYPFAIAWVEELAEFKTEDEVTTITNSLLRGELGDGLFYMFFTHTTLLNASNHGLTRSTRAIYRLTIPLCITQPTLPVYFTAVY
ncbi:hypothetical protein JOD17_000837 [Geomicrobium sediminis]|uniref:Phage terminase large subunit N-terminal domain-containing protein n=1 Tax=Geomicrobium sediminis TaxID=1347788 RepID=A0ABS2P8K8_9BACL|nr:hypothetical protein [Geomicrobium sediminis]